MHDAGRIYKRPALMNELLPGHASGGLWATLAHSQAAVQFQPSDWSLTFILFVAVCPAVYAARRNTEGKVLVFAVLGLCDPAGGSAFPPDAGCPSRTFSRLIRPAPWSPIAATALAWRAESGTLSGQRSVRNSVFTLRRSSGCARTSRVPGARPRTSPQSISTRRTWPCAGRIQPARPPDRIRPCADGQNAWRSRSVRP